MKKIYLKDTAFAHEPKTSVYGRTPKYIDWDRDTLQDVEFYTHESIMSLNESPNKKYAWLFESQAILPTVYKTFEKYKSIASNFELVFTHSSKILDSFPNAVFSIGGGVWYGTEASGGNINENQFQNKTKDVSIVSSDKIMCELHHFRLMLAKEIKKNNLCDTFGTFDGGPKVKIFRSLEQYRYSIVVENFIDEYYFTEKILNCFASMTVPIYCGATKIEKFFNPDGIIRFDPNDLTAIQNLKACTEKDYEYRLPAIIDNYNRVQKYLSIEDFMYERYRF